MKRLLLLSIVLGGAALFGQSQQLMTARQLQTDCTAVTLISQHKTWKVMGSDIGQPCI